MRSGLINGFVLGMAIAFCSCHNNPPATSGINSNKDSMSIGSYAFKTADGWGYSIIIDNKLYIKQSTVPAIAGIKGFASENDAEKVATLVMNKIKLHQKPTIQKGELRALGISE